MIGGPAPYWHTYTYDTAGSRTGETRHGIGGEDDTVRTYTYATPGSDNRMTGVAQTGAAGDSTGSYGYDATGNTTAISTTEGATTSTQTFDWNSEGNLAEVTENGSDTSHIYDADGERLIREDPGGTTLYLPDGTELRRTAGANAVTGTPYYSFGDQTVAMRTSDGTVTYMAVDHQGTAQLAVDATTQQSVVRRFTPFGAIRGFDEDATWPGEKGFVGGTRDPTDLTHLGAREYDPETGRFISVDPIMQLADEASYNGYTYAGNSPVSYSDPAGRCRSGSPACRGVGRNNQHGYYSPGNHAVWQLFRPTPRSYGPSPDRAGAGHFIPALNNIVGRYSGGAAAAPRKPVEKCGFVCKFTNFSVGFGFTLSVSPVVALAFPDNEAKVASWLGADANSSSYKAGGWTVDIAAFCVPGGGLRTAGKGGLKAFLASPFRRCRPNSFLPGTLVLMADGTKKAIQNIRVGGRGAGDRPGNR